MVADHDTAGMCVTSKRSSVRACVSVNISVKRKRHTHEINFVIWTNDFMLLLLLFNTTRAHALRAPCYTVTRVSNYQIVKKQSGCLSYDLTPVFRICFVSICAQSAYPFVSICAQSAGWWRSTGV